MKWEENKYSPIIASSKPFKGIMGEMEKFRDEIITVRSSSYSGRGRPKKTDFIKMKRRDYMDYLAFERFKNAFSYTKMYEK